MSSSRQKPARPQWQRRLRYLYVRFIRMRGSTEAIARGLASGVFAGWFPLFGLQTIIGVALAAILRGNKIMAAAGTWVSNPFTYVPIYYFNFQVGEWLLKGLGISVSMPKLQEFQTVVEASGWGAFQDFLALGAGVAGTLFLGCFVVGLVSAVCAYYLGMWSLNWLRARRQARSSQARRSSK